MRPMRLRARPPTHAIQFNVRGRRAARALRALGGVRFICFTPSLNCVRAREMNARVREEMRWHAGSRARYTTYLCVWYMG